MKKTFKNQVLLFVFIFCSLSSYSQTLDETIQWIGMNSSSREYVQYSKKENKLKIFSVRTVPGHTSIRVQEFDPKQVALISVDYRSDEFNSLLITFKQATVVRSYSHDEETKKNYSFENNSLQGIALSIKSDKQKIDKFKKAFLNLFLKLGVPVKDGNFF